MTLEKDFVSHIPGVQGVEPPAGRAWGVSPQPLSLPNAALHRHHVRPVSNQWTKRRKPEHSQIEHRLLLTAHCLLDHGPQ